MEKVLFPLSNATSDYVRKRLTGGKIFLGSVKDGDGVSRVVLSYNSRTDPLLKGEKYQ